MKTFHNKAAGFTAVELLITLFVAAAFLVGGYQLFNVIIKDSGDARAESAAGNVAYEYLRQYTDSAVNPCVASSPLTNQSVSIDGLSDLQARVSVTITCPQKDASSISQVEAVLTYGVGSEAKTVRQATFVDKSRGASSVTEITNGLIGWWKLNENASSSVGSYPHVVTDVIPATNRAGVGASAFGFNGSSANITIPYDANRQVPTTAVTISAWIFLASAPSENKAVFSNTESGGISMGASIPSHACAGGAWFSVYTGGAYRTPCTPALSTNTWTLITGTYDGATVRLYKDAVPSASTVAASGPLGYSPLAEPWCIGAEPNSSLTCAIQFFHGSIDDVRIYNRALSGSEITQLYNGGPK